MEPSDNRRTAQRSDDLQSRVTHLERRIDRLDEGKRNSNLTRRTALGIGGALGAAGLLGVTTGTAAQETPAAIAHEGRRAGQATGVTTHHIDDFGGDPTGSSPSDDAFDAMVDAADPGDHLLLTEGTYRFDARHVMTEPYTIDGSNGRIVATYGDRSTYEDSSTFAHQEGTFIFGGTRGPSTVLSGNASPGANAVLVDDPSLFEAGDDVLITGSPTGFLSRAYRPTRDRILAVDGNVLYLEGGLQYRYEAGDNTVFKLDSVVGAEVRNLSFEADGTWPDDYDTDSIPNVGIVFANTRDSLARNVSFDGYHFHAFVVHDGFRTTLVDCSAINPYEIVSSAAEPFYVVGSTNVTIVRPQTSMTRRAVDLRSGCQHLHVIEPTITDTVNHGLSFHNSPGQHVYGSMNVIGGLVSAAQFEPPIEVAGGFGHCVNGSSNASHLRITGTTFRGKGRSVDIRGDNTVVHNCSFYPVANTGRLVSIRNGAEGAVLSDCHFSPRGRSVDHAVEVEDASHVRISGLAESGFDGSVVSVSGRASDVETDLVTL